MLDAKFIREKTGEVKKILKLRKLPTKVLDDWLNKDKEFRELKGKLDSLRHQRNVVSQEISELTKEGKKPKDKFQKAKEISQKIKKSQENMGEIEKELKELTLHFPNQIDKKVGLKEKIIETKGKPKKEKYQKDYLELTKKWLDLDRAAKISGEGFILLKGDLATLQRALINFCLDTCIKNKYQEAYLPVMLNQNSVTNSGHYPKFVDGMYQTKDGFYLSPTEEVAILNMYAGKTLNGKELPINLTAFTPSFRTEKGATKGMFRIHQFDEVEVFKITKPKDSEKELKIMLSDALTPIKLLGLPYRVKLLAGWDLPNQCSITYDIEVFSPKSGWLELSSCSNCTDYQARRARIYFEEKGERKLVHTLNGTCVGINRLMIAILENFQQKDGSIKIPAVLHKYTGKKVIK
ncbi:MAG: serine--tRNA ligase [archaeon]